MNMHTPLRLLANPSLRTRITMHRILSLLLLLTANVFAEEPSVKPGINDKFLDPALKVEEWTEKFETESREIFHQRSQILASIGLKPGMKVADIGAGTGLFTRPFANAVGTDGEVYAVEISAKFVEHIRSRAQQSNLTNVKTVLCTDRSVELPEGSIDLAFICDVYHHFEFPRSSLT